MDITHYEAGVTLPGKHFTVAGRITKPNMVRLACYVHPCDKRDGPKILARAKWFAAVLRSGLDAMPRVVHAIPLTEAEFIAKYPQEKTG